ncbi:MAG TPA: glycoside hydrolase family 18 protein [Bacillota bacterium]|nr:glycoside hydrolase family 18 protein [Bacillota bacterium]
MLNAQEESKKYLLAYLADWTDWNVDMLDVCKLTHLNYAFATIKNGRVTTQHLKKLGRLQKLKLKNPNLKILISIGGWGADGFSDAALGLESRKLFTETATNIVREYKLDGIDLDWEYPCRDFAGIKARPEDKGNYTLMVRSLRKGLDDLSREKNKPYLLTMAAGASKLFADDLELEQLIQLLDFINIMTYDFHTGTNITGHHTNLYEFNEGKSFSASKAIDTFIKAGVPPHKLVLGAAFYGRGWSGLDSGSHPIGQSSQPSVSFTYADCKKAIEDKRLKRYWDRTACAPYLWDGDTFVGYDDPKSLLHKVSYVLEKELAGIMFWEWSQDVDNELLHAIYNAYQGQ